jgi:hypothetical protein
MTKNVTIAIPVSVHRKARVWAADHSTSLSAIVAHLLGNLDVLVRIRQQHDAANPPQHSPEIK